MTKPFRKYFLSSTFSNNIRKSSKSKFFPRIIDGDAFFCFCRLIKLSSNPQESYLDAYAKI